MIERTANGTGLVLKPDGTTFIAAGDYEIWYRLENELSHPSEWGGELSMVVRVRPGEYILELEPGDGRTGKIVLEPPKLRRVNGLKYYKYVFRGSTPLLLEGNSPVVME